MLSGWIGTGKRKEAKESNDLIGENEDEATFIVPKDSMAVNFTYSGYMHYGKTGHFKMPMKSYEDTILFICT